MRIKSSHTKKGYTKVNNDYLKDSQLGITERGLLTTMLSLHDNWRFSIKGLKQILPDGTEKIRNSLNKLEEAGYLIRKRHCINGKMEEMNYYFSDGKIAESDIPCEGKQDTDIQDSEKPKTVFQSSNKESTNKPFNNQQLSDQSLINQEADESREKTYDCSAYTNLVKRNISYERLESWLREYNPICQEVKFKMTAEKIVGYIIAQICSNKETETICKQKFHRETIRSIMTKADIRAVKSALKAMENMDSFVNIEKFFISTLYNVIQKIGSK